MDHDGVPSGDLLGEALEAVQTVFKTDPDGIEGGTVQRLQHLRDDAVLASGLVGKHTGAGLKKDVGRKMNLLRSSVQPGGRQGALQGSETHVFVFMRLELRNKKGRIEGPSNFRGSGEHVVGPFAPRERKPRHPARRSAVGASERESLASKAALSHPA